MDTKCEVIKTEKGWVCVLQDGKELGTSFATLKQAHVVADALNAVSPSEPQPKELGKPSSPSKAIVLSTVLTFKGRMLNMRNCRAIADALCSA